MHGRDSSQPHPPTQDHAVRDGRVTRGGAGLVGGGPGAARAVRAVRLLLLQQGLGAWREGGLIRLQLGHGQLQGSGWGMGAGGGPVLRPCAHRAHAACAPGRASLVAHMHAVCQPGGSVQTRLAVPPAAQCTPTMSSSLRTHHVFLHGQHHVLLHEQGHLHHFILGLPAGRQQPRTHTAARRIAPWGCLQGGSSTAARARIAPAQHQAPGRP